MTVSALERVVDQWFEHPEGIVWDASAERLLWVDVMKGDVVACDLATGSLATTNVGRVLGAVAPRREGGLVCAVREGFGALDTDGTFSLWADPLAGQPTMQMNDGGVDARGRFWAGSMTFEFQEKPGICSVFRLDADGELSEQLDGVSVSNGIGWSPDSTRFYYCDSATGRVDDYAFDLDAGTLGERRTLAESTAMPDGLAVDADGCIWVAMFGGSEVHRFTPRGELDRVVRLPGEQVTTCTFGGHDLRTLFIAVSPLGLDEEALRDQEAGYVYAYDAGVEGLATHEFGG